MVSGSVGACSFSQDSVDLAPGAPAARVNASCPISTTGTGGSVTLTASTTAPISFSGNGTTSVTIAPVYRIAISPAVGSASVNPGTTNTHSVVIQNTSSNSALPIKVRLTNPTCGGSIVGGCSIPDDSVSIAQGSQTSALTLTYNAIAAGNESVILIPSGTVSGGTV